MAKTHLRNSNHIQGCFQLGLQRSSGASSTQRVLGLAVAVQQCQSKAEGLNGGTNL